MYREEKEKTDRLLTDLLPRQIMREMKRGHIPQPETFESASVFLCDIVGFTQLSSESTAFQIVTLLNALYNLYDNRIEDYEVYKVETIGDAYMVVSGVPERCDHHAAEVSRMALDLLAKVISTFSQMFLSSSTPHANDEFFFQLVTFEVPHKPGFQLQMRMGIHTGSVVAGVVGTKIPHYSVFGETVEIAGVMEESGEPMRIQVCKENIISTKFCP